MKRRSISLVLVGLMLGACAGEKNEVQADGAVLAVRTVESGELTEVALLSGNFETPEAAQAAVESAQWVPMAQFSQDDELDFVEASSEGLISDANRERNFTPRDGQRNRGDNNFGNRDGRRGGNDRNFRGDNQSRGRHNNHARDNNRHNGRRFGNHRPNQDWRPHHYNNYWQSGYNKWQRPTHQYWSYRNCNYHYIWYSGRCFLPRSRAYGNYHWRPQYGYTYRPHNSHVNFSGSNWYVRLYF